MVKKLSMVQNEYSGLTTDTKPTAGVPEGSVFYAYNTSNELVNIYKYLGGAWVVL